MSVLWGNLYLTKLAGGFSYAAGVEEPLPKGESFPFFIPSSCLEDALFGPLADVQFSLYRGRVPCLWFNSVCPSLPCSWFLTGLLECGGLEGVFFQPVILVLALMWFSGSGVCHAWKMKSLFGFCSSLCCKNFVVVLVVALKGQTSTRWNAYFCLVYAATEGYLLDYARCLEILGS